MKILNWLTQRIGNRGKTLPSGSDYNEDVDHLATCILGLMSRCQSYLDSLTAMQATPADAAELARRRQEVAITAKKAVEAFPLVLRGWADWLDDPSRPMPDIPTNYAAKVLTGEEDNTGCPSPAETSSQVA